MGSPMMVLWMIGFCVGVWVCWFRETRTDLSMEEVGCGSVVVEEILVGWLSMEDVGF